MSWSFISKKLFPLQITKRLYLWVVCLIVMPMLILAAIIQLHFLEERKNNREKELSSIAEYLAKRLPASFTEILQQKDSLDKPVAEQIKVLNSVLQPIVDDLSLSHPGIGMGYYSVEQGSLVAICPDFNSSILTKQNNTLPLPIYKIYETGKPELFYSNTSVNWSGKPVLNLAYPIYRNDKMIGHTWANVKMEDLYAEAWHSGSDILFAVLLILGAILMMSWLAFSRFKKGLEHFTGAVIQDSQNPPEGILPELEPLLQLLKGHTKELKTANEQLYREITERKLADEEIKTSEARFRELFNNMNSGVIVYAAKDDGRDFIINDFNRAGEKIDKLKKEAIIGKSVLEAFPKIREFGLFEVLQRVYRTGEPEHHPALMYNDDRIAGWRENYIYRLPSGEIVAIYDDITELKQAEGELGRALAESQQREAEITALFNSTRSVLRHQSFEDVAKEIFYSCLNLVEAASGYIMLIDNHSQCYEIPFIELGGQACTSKLSLPMPIHGIHAEAYHTKKTVYHNDFVGSGWQAFIPEGHIRIDNALYAPFLIANQVVGLLGLGNKPGGFTENDTRIVSVFCEIFAVALHKSKTMGSLKNSEEKFSKVFKNSPILMSINELDGRYVDINNSFIGKTGYTREEVIGHTNEEIGLVNSSESTVLCQKMIEQKSIQNYETRIRNKSGSELIGLYSAEMINISGKEYILSLMNDVTRLRQMEKEMFRLERLNLVGEMAAGIGHEIRNPMTTVRGFLQMLRGKEDCAKYKSYYDLMIEELDRSNSIITEYLSLAKNKPIELQGQNLTAVVRAIFPLIQADAMHGDKDVSVELEENLPDILLDQKEIRQLILNLVRNGLEAMPPSGNLTIKTFMDGDEAVLSVKDQGGGIEPNIIENIGTPFFTTKDNGTGLGLAVCYSIAARHGAKIEIETGPTGTNFLVRFKYSKTQKLQLFSL